MEIILDTLRLTEPEKAHSYLKEALAFPDYYGHNLDALYDCLTEICEETVLRLRTEDGKMPDAPYLGKILRVLRDAEAENPRLKIRIGNGEEETGFSYEDVFEDNAEDDAAVCAEDGEEPEA